MHGMWTSRHFASWVNISIPAAYSAGNLASSGEGVIWLCKHVALMWFGGSREVRPRTNHLVASMLIHKPSLGLAAGMVRMFDPSIRGFDLLPVFCIQISGRLEILQLALGRGVEASQPSLHFPFAATGKRIFLHSRTPSKDWVLSPKDRGGRLKRSTLISTSSISVKKG